MKAGGSCGIGLFFLVSYDIWGSLDSNCLAESGVGDLEKGAVQNFGDLPFAAGRILCFCGAVLIGDHLERGIVLSFLTGQLATDKHIRRKRVMNASGIAHGKEGEPARLAAGDARKGARRFPLERPINYVSSNCPYLPLHFSGKSCILNKQRRRNTGLAPHDTDLQ